MTRSPRTLLASLPVALVAALVVLGGKRVSATRLDELLWESGAANGLLLLFATGFSRWWAADLTVEPRRGERE